MSENDRYIPGVPCWADATQPDPKAAVEFYGALFGWEFEDTMPAEAPGSYYVARIGGRDVAAVSSPMGGAPPRATWSTYIWVDSADAAAERVRAAGGTVLADPFDVMEAGRMAVCADPAGADFCVWEARAHRGAAVVNEPVSVVFNDLATNDVEGARAFYAAVFGWDVLNLGEAGIWTLPGYGEFLEGINPGTLAAMKEMEAPAGFEDAVATLAPLPPGQQEPGWGVTFAVDDADEIAARAGELGATVLADPFDAPWVRMTVIADPQGAVFTASKFVPENREVS